MYYFLIFNAFSVYFASQVLQQSSFIGPTSHDKITQYNVTYNALYSIGLVLGLHQLQAITLKSSVSKLLYTFWSHVGAIVFALAGEYPPIKHFSITPGFWHRLDLEGKLIISGIFFIVAILVLWQGIRAKKRRTCQRQFAPWLATIVTWFVIWITLLKGHYYVHIHHALFAGFFSCWFADFSSTLDIIVNAVFTGIVIEGIDFYGIGELTLFILTESADQYGLGLKIAWLMSLVALTCAITRESDPKKCK